MSLIRHPVLQYAFVVNDLEASCRRWTEMFGAGPFLKIPHHQGLNHRYRGMPSTEDVSHALGQSGPANIQFTQQHNDAPSIWRDMYPAGKEGLHHVMIMVADFAAEKRRFEAEGCVAAEEFETELPDGTIAHCAYMDARDKIGCFVELYEDNPIVAHELAVLKALHETWDGETDPIRLSL
jgi:hypothetical protein